MLRGTLSLNADRANIHPLILPLCTLVLHQWHVDPNHTSAYNTVLSGRKLWMLLPPHITPPGVFISHDGATVTAPLSIAEWLTDFWLHCVQQHGRRGDNTLIVDVCGPGETIYVPAGWKHLVVNLEGGTRTALQVAMRLMLIRRMCHSSTMQSLLPLLKISLVQPSCQP